MGRTKGTKNKNKTKNVITTTTKVKNIAWSSSDGVKAQKLLIQKILATPVAKAVSTDKKLEIAQEVINELKLPQPPWSAEKLKYKFMNRTSHITGSPQANENGTLNERYKKAEEYLNPNLSGIKTIIDVDKLYMDTPQLYNEDNNYGGGYDTPSSSKTTF